MVSNSNNCFCSSMTRTQSYIFFWSSVVMPRWISANCTAWKCHVTLLSQSNTLIFNMEWLRYAKKFDKIRSCSLFVWVDYSGTRFWRSIQSMPTASGPWTSSATAIATSGATESWWRRLKSSTRWAASGKLSTSASSSTTSRGRTKAFWREWVRSLPR